MATTFQKWYCIEYVVKTEDYTKFEIIPGVELQPFVTAQPEHAIKIGEPVFFGDGSLTDLTKQARIIHIADNKIKCKKESSNKLACKECQTVNKRFKRCKGQCRPSWRTNSELNLWKDFVIRNCNILKSINPNISFDRKMAVLLIFNKSHLIPCAFKRCRGCKICDSRPAAAASSPASRLNPLDYPRIGSSVFVGEFCTEVLPTEFDHFFNPDELQPDELDIVLSEIAITIQTPTEI